MPIEPILDAKELLPVQTLVEKISDLEEEVRNLRRLHLTIERNNHLFEALLASSHDGITLTRLDGTIIRVVRSLMGYATDALERTSIFDAIHPDDREAMRERYRRIAQGGIRQTRHETRLLRHDGTYIWVEGSVTDMLDDPAVQAIVHNYRNTTEEKAGLLATAELASVVSHAPFAVFSKSPAGDILTWNEGARQMFGYDPAEILGRNIEMLIPPDLREQERQARSAVLQLMAATPKISTWRLRKHGARFPVELVLSPLMTHGRIHGIAHLSYPLPEK